VPEEFICPINLDKIHCQNCYFSKEGFCDYPYSIDNIFRGSPKLAIDSPSLKTARDGKRKGE